MSTCPGAGDCGWSVVVHRGIVGYRSPRVKSDAAVVRELLAVLRRRQMRRRNRVSVPRFTVCADGRGDARASGIAYCVTRAFPASRNSVCLYPVFRMSGTTTSPCSPRTTCQASCSFSLPLRFSPLKGAWTRTEDEGWKMEDGGWEKRRLRSSFLIPQSSFLVPRLRFPRASAGFMILAASMLPSALPAPRVRNSLLCHRSFRVTGTPGLTYYWAARLVRRGISILS